MKTIGFPISLKENERRRVIVPDDLSRIIAPYLLYVEKGYGEILGINDDEYKNAGAVVTDRETVLKQSIICDLKVGDAEYLESLLNGQTLFGWIHISHNDNLRKTIINKRLSVYAWEKMYIEEKHVFWYNNELAGFASVLDALRYFGRVPKDLNVAIIGSGNTSKGAYRILNALGSKITFIKRNQESFLRETIHEYDVIVNCVLWDTNRDDHIIYREDIKKMRKDSMIIDVSCDLNGAIETSVPTTFINPTYITENVIHYVVDHTPSMFFKNFSYDCSKIIVKYLNSLMTDEIDEVLDNAALYINGIEKKKLK